MNNPTQLLPTDIIAVEVPREAREFSIVELSKKRKALSYIIDEYGGYSGCFKDIPNDNFELLGEATETEISKELKDFLFHNWYWTEGELRDLLQANGLYWVNPMGEENFTDSDGYVLDEIAHKEWQEAENKKIKGKLIFLKKL